MFITKLFLWLSCSQLVLSAKFEFVRTGSRLPFAMGSHTAVYDGHDSVYIVGGSIGTFLNEVIRYTLSTGNIDSIGKFISVKNAAAIFDPLSGDIFHFGGWNVSDIYRYSTLNGSYSVINRLPVPMSDMASASDGEHVYLFGGLSETGRLDTILQYNIRSNQLIQVGTLSEAKRGATAVWADDSVFVFGGRSGKWDTLHYVPATKNITKLTTRLPFLVFNDCSVYANGKAYIMGHQGLMQFDPVTELSHKIEVQSRPIIWDSACVYVPKFGRMYEFGGFGKLDKNDRDKYLDLIAYIQLHEPIPNSPTTSTTATTIPVTTTNEPHQSGCICPSTIRNISTTTTPSTSAIPTPTTTQKLPITITTMTTTAIPTTSRTKPPPNDCSDGQLKYIPHPTCCESYYICGRGMRTKLDCENGQQFNPINSRCQDADIVQCGLKYGGIIHEFLDDL